MRNKNMRMIKTARYTVAILTEELNDINSILNDKIEEIKSTPDGDRKYVLIERIKDLLAEKDSILKKLNSLIGI